jgi:hypothetical protein
MLQKHTSRATTQAVTDDERLQSATTETAVDKPADEEDHGHGHHHGHAH